MGTGALEALLINLMGKALWFLGGMFLLAILKDTISQFIAGLRVFMGHDVDIENLDNMFALAISSDLDYVRHEQSIAGLLSEIVSFSALEKVQKLTTKEEDLEHVTVYILNHENDFKVDIKRTKVKSNSTYTIDYRRDLDFCNNFLKENNKNSLINIIWTV